MHLVFKMTKIFACNLYYNILTYEHTILNQQLNAFWMIDMHVKQFTYSEYKFGI